MTHEQKYRYVFGIPGKPESYFFRYFTIEEIEAGFAHNWLCAKQIKNKEMEIISRDQFIGKKDKNGKDVYTGDIDKTFGKVDIWKGMFGFILNHQEFISVFEANFKASTEIIGNIYGVPTKNDNPNPNEDT